MSPRPPTQSTRGDDGTRGVTYSLVDLHGEARVAIHGPILVGRGPYNHVVIDDTRVSWQHARIAPQQNGLVIYDLNSRNGTLVNGAAVTRQSLEPGDVLSFGKREYRIESSVPEEEEPAEARFDPEGATIGDAGGQWLEEEMRDRIPTVTSEIPALVNLNHLEDAYQKLGKLYSFVQAICTTIDKKALLGLIAAKTREVYPRSNVGIYLRGSSDGDPRAFQLAHVAGGAVPLAAPLLPEDVRARVFAERKAVLMAGGMYAPMIDRGETLGVIHVAARGPASAFGHADLDLLTGMATPAALMLQNTRMHEESLLRDRLKYDLELAAEIQRSFLPSELMVVDGVDLFAEYRAAYGIGGDFYDIFWVGPERLGVFIGDISGKGVSAALVMARTSSELRSTALALVEPVAVLTAMNKALIARQQPELFFTGIYFTLDVTTGEIELANAGHPPPYLRRAAGGVEPFLAGASGAIGIFDDATFESARFRLGDGDSLVLYTDGIIEAPSSAGELYGEGRVAACLAASSSHPAELAHQLLASVDEHAAGVTVRDDLTIFVCRRSRPR
jgi:phosphoserine phosphatase RsbU/P